MRQAGVEAVDRNLDLELITREVRSADDIGQGIDAVAAGKVTAINVLASALFYDRRALIIERTRALGLPTIYWWADLAREGGLISFGPNFEEAHRLLARQVSRVLNGVTPAKLPIIQPTRFELVVNLKTARTQSRQHDPKVNQACREIGQAREVGLVRAADKCRQLGARHCRTARGPGAA